MMARKDETAPPAHRQAALGVAADRRQLDDKGLLAMNARQEIAGRARALAMTDETAAQILNAKGDMVVAPKGLVRKDLLSVSVSLGWADVRVAMHKDGRRAAFTTLRGGSYSVRAGRGDLARERVFWRGDGVGDDYWRAYVQACGIPTLQDFELTLTAWKDRPLGDQAEKSARQRSKQYDEAYDLPPGWFMALYRKQGGLCGLSGLPMLRRNGLLCECLPVPDRIDSAKGYTSENVRLVRHGLNMMRRDRDDATFARLCKSMFLLQK